MPLEWLSAADKSTITDPNHLAICDKLGGALIDEVVLRGRRGDARRCTPEWEALAKLNAVVLLDKIHDGGGGAASEGGLLSAEDKTAAIESVVMYWAQDEGAGLSALRAVAIEKAVIKNTYHLAISETLYKEAREWGKSEAEPSGVWTAFAAAPK